MYVGQTKRLYERLRAHTKDTLSDRWDEFSWFSLQEAGNENHSDKRMSDISAKRVLDLLEAVLIEAILPPLNDKAGNKLGPRCKQYP